MKNSLLSKVTVRIWEVVSGNNRQYRGAPDLRKWWETPPDCDIDIGKCVCETRCVSRHYRR